MADYLKETRVKWSERLHRCRTALEHQGWAIPKVVYVVDSGRARAIEPLIDGQLATEFVVHMVDRVCCFVEEMCMFTLQAHMPEGVSITEIPVTKRKPDIKERFQLALVGGGMPIWSIAYHESKFEET